MMKIWSQTVCYLFSVWTSLSRVNAKWSHNRAVLSIHSWCKIRSWKWKRRKKKLVEGNREAEMGVVGVLHADLGFLARVRRRVLVANHNDRNWRRKKLFYNGVTITVHRQWMNSFQDNSTQFNPRFLSSWMRLMYFYFEEIEFRPQLIKNDYRLEKVSEACHPEWGLPAVWSLDYACANVPAVKRLKLPKYFWNATR